MTRLTNKGGHVNYFHFTDYYLWKKTIERVGLLPQPIKQPSIKSVMEKTGIRGLRGIWLWVREDKNIVRDFYLNRRIEKGVKRGILLRVELFPEFLLSKLACRRWNSCSFKHDLIFDTDNGEKVFHLDEPFDIYVNPIVPANITPVMEVGIEVKKIGHKRSHKRD